LENHLSNTRNIFTIQIADVGKVVKLSRFIQVMIGCVITMVSLSGVSVYAHHILPNHNLKCSKNFPCPKELERRIDFWIQVFKGWDKKTAVFHDPQVPERVYSVVKTGDGCSSRVASKIKKERKRIKTGLYNAAANLESGNTISADYDLHLAKLFPSGNPAKLRRAAENIRCQSGVKDSFREGLQRFNRYSYLVDTVLQQYKLPPEIRYLPFVESSYNPAAYSKAGAAGMWQIMPRTARTLGLELDATLDERLDPEAATHAAARYLVNSRKSLTELARSIDPNITDEEINPFVITSYNYGLNGMRRAIRKVKPDYLTVLEKYKSPSFQIAVKNFYSSFLAAQHVTLNAHQYFGDIAKDQKVRYQTLVLKNATSVDRIESVFKLTETELKPLNLGLTRFIWHGWRMIPAGYQLKLPYRKNGYKAEIARLDSLAPETVAPGSDSYVVRKGDTACGIARALRVNCRELINLNRLGKKAVIRIGQKLAIPRQLVVVSQPSNRLKGEPDTKVISQSKQEFSYRVKRGDTACGIAEKYNVSCRTLISVNQLGRKAKIKIGQSLLIPGIPSQAGLLGVLDENNRYQVRKGDYACSIARRFSVSCSDLKRLNNLNKKATIFPGQKLKIPGLEVPDTTETVEQLAQVDQAIVEATSQSDDESAGNVVESPDLSNLLDTLPDLSVSITGSSGNPVYRIWIEADETLGHYSDWLGMRSTIKIRNLNKMGSGNDLRIGRTLKLPISSGNMVAEFEQKRIEYHQVLSESLKAHYTLIGIEKYTVRSGDSAWSLSRQSGFPLWLLYRLNPELKISSLRKGQVILLPKLREN
jgi:membrane-bound lytic murein transglycosylase D